MLDKKLAAVAVVFLLLGTSIASDLDNEQLSRLQALKARAAAGKTTVGDMHEGGAHYRVLAARNRDSGLEGQLDALLRNTANETKLLNACVASGRKGVTRASCQAGLAMLRSNGSHTMMQAVASVAYNANQWGSFIPVQYPGGARYVPVILPNCYGVRQAIDVSFLVEAGMGLIPGGEIAAGIGLFFSGFLLLAADSWC